MRIPLLDRLPRLGPRVSLQDKVVAITGGASGIGLALGHAFASRGARVALLDLDGEAANSRARELNQTLHLDAIGLRCDVSSEAECASAIAAVIERFGGIDVLVNNAGITAREAFADTSMRTIRKVMEVNFFGSVACTQEALPSLLERRGSVIVISSTAGLVPLLGRSGYSASKHALHGLFATLRAELRDQGLHVLIVCPSFVRTDLQTRALGGDGEVTAHPQSTVGSVATPEEIAEAICHATERRQELLLPAPVAHLSHWLNFLVPSIFERLMTRQVRSELERT